MGKIIGGVILQAIGITAAYNCTRVRDGGLAVVLAIGGTAGFVGGIYILLDGIREFFTADILAELKKISQNTVPAAKAE